MHHNFIDRYSDRSSAIHGLDAVTKIVASIIVLICILSTPYEAYYLLLIYTALLAAFWALSGVPPVHLLKRLGLAIPFIALIALGTLFTEGSASTLGNYFMIVYKAALAIAVVTILTSTTRFPYLLKGFGRLGMPRVISAILAFLYRYIFILIDEAERLNMGRKSRNFSSSLKLAWKGRAWMTGTLFIRSMDRSERIYRAMLSRGFTGQIKTMNHTYDGTALNMLTMILIIIIFTAIRMIPFMINIWEKTI